MPLTNSASLPYLTSPYFTFQSTISSRADMTGDENRSAAQGRPQPLPNYIYSLSFITSIIPPLILSPLPLFFFPSLPSVLFFLPSLQLKHYLLSFLLTLPYFLPHPSLDSPLLPSFVPVLPFVLTFRPKLRLKKSSSFTLNPSLLPCLYSFLRFLLSFAFLPLL